MAKLAVYVAALAIGTVAATSCTDTGPSESGPSSEAPTRESSAVPGTDTRVDTPLFVRDVRAAIEAVENELGGPQTFFEVTANEQFTNVFVAVDEGAAAVGYVFVDGELQPPSPKQDGATGKTFTAADIDFDPALVTSGVATDLPTSTIDAISVYGNGFGAVYVLAASSTNGGFLDIEVGPQGDVRSVDPV